VSNGVGEGRPDTVVDHGGGRPASSVEGENLSYRKVRRMSRKGWDVCTGGGATYVPGGERCGGWGEGREARHVCIRSAEARYPLQDAVVAGRDAAVLDRPRDSGSPPFLGPRCLPCGLKRYPPLPGGTSLPSSGSSIAESGDRSPTPEHRMVACCVSVSDVGWLLGGFGFGPCGSVRWIQLPVRPFWVCGAVAGRRGCGSLFLPDVGFSVIGSGRIRV